MRHWFRIKRVLGAVLIVCSLIIMPHRAVHGEWWLLSLGVVNLVWGGTMWFEADRQIRQTEKETA